MPAEFLAEALEQLSCPISTRCASVEARERAQHEAVGWARQVGLIGSRTQLGWASAWNVAEFAGRVYGQAADLSLAAQWIMWMDIIDDIVESLPVSQIGAALHPITAILRKDDPTAVEPGASPVVSAFADLWQRTRLNMSPTWRTRVAQAWIACADSMPWEAVNRARGRAPALEDYIARRPTAGAAYLALLLTDGLYDHELPDALHHCGPLSALRTLACEHICWTNDLYSLAREEAKGDVHNLVLVLEHHRSHDRPDAVRETVRMVNERMQAITHLVNTLPDYQHTLRFTVDECRLLDHTVDSILQWISGSLHFHQISTRHRDHHNPHGNPFLS